MQLFSKKDVHKNLLDLTNWKENIVQYCNKERESFLRLVVIHQQLCFFSLLKPQTQSAAFLIKKKSTNYILKIKILKYFFRISTQTVI